MGTFEGLGRDRSLRALVEMLAERRGPVQAAGLWGSSAPIAAGLAARMLAAPLLYVTAHLNGADDARDDLEHVWPGDVLLLPPFDTLPRKGGASAEIAAERAAVCRAVYWATSPARSGAPARPEWALVAPTQALLQPVPSPGALAARSLLLRRGEVRDLAALAAWLVDHGFTRLDLVESPGDFAVRGEIVDVFPWGEEYAVRIEFAGEEIESLRRFDPATQRSVAAVDEVVVSALEEGDGGGGDVCLADVLPDDVVIVLDEPSEIDELARAYWSRSGEDAGLVRPETLFASLGRYRQVHLSVFGGAGNGPAVSFSVRSLQRFETHAGAAVAELLEMARTKRVVVFCENSGERNRLAELIAETAAGLADGDRAAARIELADGVLHRGFVWEPGGVAYVGHQEIFHRQHYYRRLRRVPATRPVDSWLDLRPGDFVVHVNHGIARFRGMQVMRKEGTQQEEEYLTLEFANRAVLHVPVSQIDRVHKYIGAGGLRPMVSTLGGTRWKKTRQRVAEAVSRLAEDLLRVQAARLTQEGIAYPQDTAWQREFEAEFPYVPTEDQQIVTQEIKEDMCRPRPMDRLVCGDVGYGKTELAMRAAFKAAEYGKQVAVLVPTTVLAEQHLMTFRERFADYPFVIESLSRFRSPAEQRRILQAVRKGQVDILIGTHRMLSSDVVFRDLGLVIIDEEQRFGVEHKERLKRLRATVDVLTLTATPIPRTLHMALLGIRDISSLTTPPLDRRSIVTRVCAGGDEIIREAIVRELNREGQVFFVHNRVHDIQTVAERVRRLVPEARVLVGHGQMPEHALEQVMLDFLHRRADVLVCTTIIESGIDMPNVNTILIDEAERFGLADLHQLRGRVGRYKHRAYCYLLVSPGRTLLPAAVKRLKAIEEFSELGAGFRIAMRDLEIRGAGNILGPEQSGHIAAVGYELYCQLLREAVQRLRNEEVRRPPTDVTLSLDVSGHIPLRYIRSAQQRMEAYRRIAACRSIEDVARLEQDLRDAYGALPADVQRLLALAEIRVLAVSWGVRSITRCPPDIVFVVDDLRLAEQMLYGATGFVRMVDEKTVYWRPPAEFLDRERIADVLREQLGARCEVG